jgi:hypothetical protein
VTNRREFLQTAAALSAAPLAGRAAFAADRPRAVLDAVLADTRHAEGGEFAELASRLGAPLRLIEGDITDLWQNELRLRWQSGKAAAIAGLTERPALFLLERLAWDHGMRVVFEAEHTPDGSGAAAHRVLRTADPHLARDLDAAGGRWPSVLADAVIAGGSASRDFRPTSAALAAHLGEATKLYSWIIAPRSAV